MWYTETVRKCNVFGALLLWLTDFKFSIQFWKNVYGTQRYKMLKYHYWKKESWKGNENSCQRSKKTPEIVIVNITNNQLMISEINVHRGKQ